MYSAYRLFGRKKVLKYTKKIGVCQQNFEQTPALKEANIEIRTHRDITKKPKDPQFQGLFGVLQ